MKAALREIYLAPTRAQAEVAVDLFAEAYGARYPKAVDCIRDLPSNGWTPLIRSW
jgi:putative transposase